MAGSVVDGSRPGLVALAAVTGVEFLENGLVMFSAAPITEGLGLSPEGFAFASTLYAVAAIFMLYQHQWLAERLGYRRFVGASLLCFAAGSALCAVAGGLGLFAAGRAVQGIGGATFFTAGRMAVNDLPEALRLRGMAVFVASLLAASAVAPVLAAGLIGLGGWPALFWFGCGEALLVAWLAAPSLSARVVPPGERSEQHWGGLIWLALGIFGLQYAIQRLSAVDRQNQPEMLIVAFASIAVLAAFALRQWHRERPLIDYRGLFQSRYLLGLLLYFGGYLMAGLSGFLVPYYLHEGLRLSLAHTAALTSFGLSGSVLAALVHFAAARRWPLHRSYMLAGLGLYALGNVLLGGTSPHGDLTGVAVAIFLCATALPLYLGPVAMGTFSELHVRVFSHGYQVKNMVRQLGLSSSIAGATLALQFFGAGEATAAACRQVFLLLALPTLPLAAVVMAQRIFR